MAFVRHDNGHDFKRQNCQSGNGKVMTRRLIVSAAALLCAIAVRGQAVVPVLYELPDARRYSVPVAYHLESCELMKSFNMKPVSPTAILKQNLHPCSACKPLDTPAVAELMRKTASPYVGFVSAEVLPMRAEPNDTARVVGQLGAADLAELYDAQPGWAKISSRADYPNTPVMGWVKASTENLVARELQSAISAWLKGRAEKWPEATRTAVIKGEVKIGFTVEQVDASLGAATASAMEETAAGVTEVRTYVGKSVTIVGGKVMRIVTIK